MTNDDLQTQLVRGGFVRGSGEHSEALYLTSSFVFASAADAAKRFNQKRQDNYVYSRFSNPTVTTFCQRMAALEGGACALATASGMSAILTVLMGTCRSGSRVLCAADVFGATRNLLTNFLTKFGVQVQFVYSTDLAQWQDAMQDGVDVVLVETPSNPMHTVYDLAALAAAAHAHGALLVVDNCFCAGSQQPLAWGADIVVHSATKYLDGQGRAIGGVVVGAHDLLMERMYPFLRQGGCVCSPFAAWLFSRGLETLALRVAAHSASALAVAKWLQKQPQVAQVWHTALPDHPQHALAMQQQNNRGGGIVTLAVRGGRAAAWRLIDGLKLFSITANFGDAKSTATHPASTTHSQLSEDDQHRIGLRGEVVRLSIGLEPVDSLIADLASALKSV